MSGQVPLSGRSESEFFSYREVSPNSTKPPGNVLKVLQGVQKVQEVRNSWLPTLILLFPFSFLQYLLQSPRHRNISRNSNLGFHIRFIQDCTDEKFSPSTVVSEVLSFENYYYFENRNIRDSFFVLRNVRTKIPIWESQMEATSSTKYWTLKFSVRSNFSPSFIEI